MSLIPGGGLGGFSNVSGVSSLGSMHAASEVGAEDLNVVFEGGVGVITNPDGSER
jgi:hypothetical protein